jgi:hypothetical protein
MESTQRRLRKLAHMLRLATHILRQGDVESLLLEHKLLAAAKK